MVSWGYSCRLLGAMAVLIPATAWADISNLQEPAAPKKELSLEDVRLTLEKVPARVRRSGIFKWTATSSWLARCSGRRSKHI